MTSKLQILWHKYIRQYGQDFCVENEKFKCNKCDIFLNVTRRSQIDQHIKTKKHIDCCQINPSNDQDNEDNEVVNEVQAEFNRDLFNAFVKSDIPLTKLENDELKNFLLKYTNIELPSERTLRRMLLPEYQKALSDIRSHIGSNNIWISIDETCDIAGRSVVNVIVGILDGLPDKKPILIHVEYTQPPNHSIIAQVFENALSKLWPDGKHYERVLLFVTDGASYMKKAAKALKIIYPKMLHITCIIHGLHRVCETIRTLFQSVDNLITEGKRVFRKAPKRIQLLKQLNSNLPIPPQPTITRWGTWLEASVYYYNYFSEFKIIVNSLDSTEAASILNIIYWLT
ncbi:uncharacterized protein LOC112539635 [Tetranychus urticae]|uniref:uncharacterized protein LOC112539635 n=1 Tax=Tetranychus urticae TaxID=32264 RepID=UPI000D648571|nr:uncharacterized protein LOC112539635 [Tetranychus urticae]